MVGDRARREAESLARPPASPRSYPAPKSAARFKNSDARQTEGPRRGEFRAMIGADRSRRAQPPARTPVTRRAIALVLAGVLLSFLSRSDVDRSPRFTRVSRTNARRRLAWVLVVALVIRLLLLVGTVAMGPRIADERDYVELATSLVDGRGFAFRSGPTVVAASALPCFHRRPLGRHRHTQPSARSSCPGGAGARHGMAGLQARRATSTTRGRPWWPRQ